MVRATLIGVSEVTEHGTLAEALEAVRGYWNEAPEGPKSYLLENEVGWGLAAVLRDQADPELCHTLYADGRVEHHRCRYVLDGRGRYLRTEVEALPELPQGWQAA